MKLRYLFLFFLPIMLSGCENENFFNIQNSMQVPSLSQEQENLSGVAKDYLKSDFRFNYFPVNNRYYSTLSQKFENKSEKEYQIMFCQAENKPENLHILFVSKNSNGHFYVVDEISEKINAVEKIYFKDINEDGKNEILISKNKDETVIDVYSINNDKIYKLKSLENLV